MSGCMIAPQAASLIISSDTYCKQQKKCVWVFMLLHTSGCLKAVCSMQVARLNVPYVLMHMRGNPRTMQSAGNTAYTPGALSEEVGQELQRRAEAAIAAGIEPWRIILDPGEVASGDKSKDFLGNYKVTESRHEMA